MGFLLSLLGILTKGPLTRIFDTIDKTITAKTDQQRIKADVATEYAKAQVAALNGPGGYLMFTLMALFVLPLGFWFASICVYNVFWCAHCKYPATWTIAAMPSPLDEWSGWIVMTIFGGGAALAGFLHRK